MLCFSDSDSHWGHQVCKVVCLTHISTCWTRNVLLVWRGTAGRGMSSSCVTVSQVWPSTFKRNIKIMDVTEFWWFTFHEIWKIHSDWTHWTLVRKLAKKSFHSDTPDHIRRLHYHILIHLICFCVYFNELTAEIYLYIPKCVTYFDISITNMKLKVALANNIELPVWWKEVLWWWWWWRQGRGRRQWGWRRWWWFNYGYDYDDNEDDNNVDNHHHYHGNELGCLPVQLWSAILKILSTKL